MIGQKLQQKQQQRLSPQQIQTIRMLEYSAVEMEERVKQELEENPALEEGVDPTANPADDTDFDEAVDNTQDEDTDLSLGDYRTEDDIPDYKLAEISNSEDRREEASFSSGLSLQEYLLEQLGLRDLTDFERKIGEYIIGNIDNNGYLRRELVSITDDLIFKANVDANEEEIRSILTVIQDFDPPGVGARDLKECLLIQLEKKQKTPYTVKAINIITHHFDAFVKKHYDKIQKILSISEAELKKVLREITVLNPKPGNSLAGGLDTTVHVIPDFIVENINDNPTLIMNQGDIPHLHINREYTDMFDDYTNNKANQTSEMRNAIQFVKQKLDAAQWFIDSIKQRHNTLQRTMQAIISLQKDFFLTGDESRLHPMILKDIAQSTGYDISTISRVSNSKYVQTCFGTFPLRYFFSESMQTESGKEISTREIKQFMRQSIDAEDKRNPITDDELSALLKAKGYVIARRTLAKYREQLGIPVARLRKEL